MLCLRNPTSELIRRSALALPGKGSYADPLLSRQSFGLRLLENNSKVVVCRSGPLGDDRWARDGDEGWRHAQTCVGGARRDVHPCERIGGSVGGSRSGTQACTRDSRGRSGPMGLDRSWQYGHDRARSSGQGSPEAGPDSAPDVAWAAVPAPGPASTAATAPAGLRPAPAVSSAVAAGLGVAAAGSGDAVAETT